MANPAWTDPMDWEDDCPQCGGEGFIADCPTEYACVDPESGCELCMRRCDYCKPIPPALTELEEKSDG